MSEMPSSGGFARAMSFDRSPVVLLAFALLCAALLPKNDITEVVCVVTVEGELCGVPKRVIAG